MAFDLTNIVDTLLGSDKITKDDVSKQENKQTGTVKTDSTSSQDTKSTQQTGSVTAIDQLTKTDTSTFLRNLDDKSIESLNNVLSRLGGEFSLSNLSDLERRITGSSDLLVGGAGQFLERALKGDAELANTINPILQAAQLKNNRDVQGQVRAASENAGSAFNSLVADVGARAVGDANINFAALAAEIVGKNRQQVTSEIAAALANLNSATGTLAEAGVAIPLAEAQINASNAGAAANIGNVLKGAISQGTSNSVSKTTGRNETQSTINTNSNTKTTGSDTKTLDINNVISTIGKTSVNDKTSILDILKAL